MKKLMIGNQAIARGLYEGGLRFMSAYPGTPSTEITEFAAQYDDVTCEWAPNEKVALEAVFGASLAGALLCVLLWRPVGGTAAMLAGAAAVVALRLLAAHFRWSLPRAQ